MVDPKRKKPGRFGTMTPTQMANAVEDSVDNISFTMGWRGADRYRLLIGARHELEHAETLRALHLEGLNVAFAVTLIALDHLMEHKDYYERLEAAGL